MDTTLKMTIQNNETSLPKGKRDILAFPSVMLVPCSVSENPDDFEIQFDLTGLSSFDEVETLSLQEKYRFLYNCSKLEQLCAEYSISLAPDNLYVDINLLPQLLQRDIGYTSSEDFLAQYKALIGSVLAPKHSFDDYYNGGTDLYRKNECLRFVCCEDSSLLTASALSKQYAKECKITKEKKVVVQKARFRLHQILLPFFAIVTIGCTIFSGYLGIKKLPFKDTLIRGNNAYLKNDYLSVQKELSDISVTDLPNESKYILARSYVVTESLNSAQKDNILTMLIPQTDTVYYDYWIELGRLHFDEAIDAAQRIGDDQLLLLAYIKYEAFLETDTQTLTGDEKAQKISDLKGKIEKLSNDIKSDRGENEKIDETLDDTVLENEMENEVTPGKADESTEETPVEKTP